MSTFIETISSGGRPTTYHTTQSADVIVAIVATTLSTVSAQLQIKVGDTHFDLGSALTAAGFATISNVPLGAQLRINVTGTGFTTGQATVAIVG